MVNKYDLYDYCYYCERKFGTEAMQMTKDHIIPKSRGGNSSTVNKVYCCLQCNLLKSDFVPGELIRQITNYLTGKRKVHHKVRGLIVRYDAPILWVMVDNLHILTGRINIEYPKMIQTTYIHPAKNSNR